MNMKLKVLFFDIETAPLLAHVWHPYGDFVGVDQMVKDSFMLTWAAKWEDSDEILSAKLTSEEAIAQDDTRIVIKLANLIRKADIVVAHNSDKFDIPKLNARLFILGLKPLGPTQSIDTLKLSRKNFRLPYNKLDWLAQSLGLGNKIKTDFTLWRDVYRGDSKAITEMLTYNKHDVVLLQQVFERMKPYVTRLTRMHEAERDHHYICPSCGAEGPNNFRKRGYYRTQASTFTKYQCKSCGRYHRSRSAIPHKRAKLYPL